VSELFTIDANPRNVTESIKIIGVGGGGNNALNHIIRGGLEGVHFIAANTDLRNLEQSAAETRITLGEDLTKGLGAGGNPEVGASAAKESADLIKAQLRGADMVFLTAGMGGGTGTGASPVIASIARDLGILVVAVVTRPFSFEGKKRMNQAMEGVRKLREQVDAFILISNDRLLSLAEKNDSLLAMFAMADDVLRQAVQGVSDLILRPGKINVDFADVRSVMTDAGMAIMGIGRASGKDRALAAAQIALRSPLMEVPMNGARGVLFNITGGPDMSLHEVYTVSDVLSEATHEEANVIWGHVQDASMENEVEVTVIATGFPDEHMMENDATRDFALLGEKRPAPGRATAVFREKQEPETSVSKDGSIVRRHKGKS
jgi:cell division protein FtsZ